MITADQNSIPNREGTLQAVMHIIDCELKLPKSDPAKAIILGINALSIEDQIKVGERLIAYLKEQLMKINQKS